MTDAEKKIISDDDWKTQAKKEKEKLVEGEKKQETQTPTGQAGPAQTPPANFLTLINSLVVQAMFYLGKLTDPNSKEKPQIDLDIAKHHIDLLEMLEGKTKGNLSKEETDALSMSLHEMRMMFVQSAG